MSDKPREADFYVGDRLNLEDVGISMPPPPPELLLEWSRELRPDWQIAIGEREP